jgi:hypothetical protein
MNKIGLPRFTAEASLYKGGALRAKIQRVAVGAFPDWCICMETSFENGSIAGCYDCVQKWFECPSM